MSNLPSAFSGCVTSSLTRGVPHSASIFIDLQNGAAFQLSASFQITGSVLPEHNKWSLGSPVQYFSSSFTTTSSGSAANYTGNVTANSFTGDGSKVTAVVSASHAVTSSYAVSASALNHQLNFGQINADTGSAGNFKFSNQVVGTRFDNGSRGGNYTLDWNNGNFQRICLTGSVTLTFNNPLVGAVYLLDVVLGLASASLTYPGNVISFSNNPASSKGSGSCDSVGLIYSTTSYKKFFVGLNNSLTE